MNREQVLTPLRKLIISISIILILVIGGTIGFSIIEGMPPLEGLYMTVITLSTVGFGEVRPLHAAGRLFVITLIVFSVIAGTFAVSALGQFVLEGQLRNILGRRKMRSRIKRLSEHYIIAGFGRVGREVAHAFTRGKAPFIVIENNNATLNQLDAEGYLYVEGHATEDDVLLAAGIEKAKALVSTLPSEADNVYLALTARHMKPSLYIITRADHPDGEKKLKRAGANQVVSPHVLGGMRMAMASLRPNVVDFMQMTSMGESGLGIEEVTVPEKCRFSGKSLIDSRVKADYGVTVIGIKKADKDIVINPPPTALIETGDILLLIGSTDNLERFTGEMGGP
jgi:voltage-gated potassium channel